MSHRAGAFFLAAGLLASGCTSTPADRATDPTPSPSASGTQPGPAGSPSVTPAVDGRGSYPDPMTFPGPSEAGSRNRILVRPARGHPEIWPQAIADGWEGGFVVAGMSSQGDWEFVSLHSFTGADELDDRFNGGEPVTLRWAFKDHTGLTFVHIRVVGAFLYVIAYEMAVSEGWLHAARISRDGTIDRSYTRRHDGPVSSEPEAFEDDENVEGVILPDGRVRFCLTSNSRSENPEQLGLFGLREDGSRDRSLGPDGFRFGLSPHADGCGSITSQGDQLLIGTYTYPSFPDRSTDYELRRTSANGDIDRSFGILGERDDADAGAVGNDHIYWPVLDREYRTQPWSLSVKAIGRDGRDVAFGDNGTAHVASGTAPRKLSTMYVASFTFTPLGLLVALRIEADTLLYRVDIDDGSMIQAFGDDGVLSMRGTGVPDARWDAPGFMLLRSNPAHVLLIAPDGSPR